jgi:alpha-beta hydrolase superfamily lysophospholipase
LLAVAAALLTACGGDASKPIATAQSQPPSVVRKCGETRGAHVRPFWLRTSDGQRLYAARGGGGNVGIVLAPESPPGSVCGWLPYIATLEQAGMRVIAFDFRGTGNSSFPSSVAGQGAYGRDFAAAIASIRADGASQVVVIGASLGAARALAYGSQLDTDAIISLSGETALPEFDVNALASVSRLRVPLLLVGSRRDAYLPVRSALQLLRRAGSTDKQTAFFPGGWHGWQIVEDAPYARRARGVILGWIRAHTRP